jgi:glutathione-regulated potassium-efflux system protein KefB
MFAKSLAIYGVARLLRAEHAEARERAVLMAQGGEFAFVLYAAAVAAGVIDREVNANFSAIVVLSMALTPLVVLVADRYKPARRQSMEGIEAAEGLSGSVLLIGFGRFGQVVSQALLARDVDVSIIDNDVDMIRSADDFGFKIYYGDGSRLDVLHASGAAKARAIAICINDKDASSRIVGLARQEFPQARLLVRSFDRQHSLELVQAGVDVQVRETFESAMRFGEAALRELGVPADEAAEIAVDVRRRDTERFQLEIAGGNVRASRPLLRGNKWKPTPLIEPRREGQALSQETQVVAQEESHADSP